MGAECEKHGVDLHGNEWSEGGLVCPVCEREAEIQSLRQQLSTMKERYATASRMIEAERVETTQQRDRAERAEQQLERLREAVERFLVFMPPEWIPGAREQLRFALAELEKGELVGMKPESLDAIREMERIDRAAELEKGERDG